MAQAEDAGRQALTPRQRHVASLVARGLTNQQIAHELVLTPGTAANHVQQILRRLGLGSRSELAVWASQRGLAVAENRLLTTLQRLLEIDPRDLDSALDAAAQSSRKRSAPTRWTPSSTSRPRQPWSPVVPAQHRWGANSAPSACIGYRLPTVGVWSRFSSRGASVAPGMSSGTRANCAGSSRPRCSFRNKCPIGNRDPARGRANSCFGSTRVLQRLRLALPGNC